jgi:protein-disulfide isomerase
MEKNHMAAGSEGEEIVNTNIMVERKDRFLPISILVAALLIGGALIFATLYKGGSGDAGALAGAGNNGGAAQQGGTPGATAPAPNPAAFQLGARDAILGSANAPVTVIEYGDYQCPFCSRFFTGIQPRIVQQYVNSGKVKFVFRDFAFLGAESTAAGQAAACAEDQNKLWPYHDALYTAKAADFAKGGGEDDGFFSRAEFLKLAQQVGLDMPTFTSCLDTNKDAAIVQTEVSDAQTAGVNSTPTTFVDGKEVLESNGQSAGADPTAILAAIAAAVKG